MGFTRRLIYFLVHQLHHTNKEAKQLIQNGDLEVDGSVVTENCLLDDVSEIRIKGEIVRSKKKFDYLKFYKPAGFQSSLNKNVADNLSEYFKEYSDLAIAGRLDKASEGLLILSNDGKWVEKICHPKFEKEKEYIVVLDKHPDKKFIETFSSGVLIGGYLTQPCVCKVVDEKKISVILKEGKNRQIRRMCHKLGYGVEKLTRIRIGEVRLDNLQAFEIQLFARNVFGNNTI